MYEIDGKPVRKLLDLYQGRQTTACGSKPVICLWNIATATCLPIIYGCFMLGRQSLVYAAETVYPKIHEVFTMWTFKEKVDDL